MLSMIISAGDQLDHKIIPIKHELNVVKVILEEDSVLGRLRINC